MSNWAIRRTDNGTWYRGGWIWRWTRFACFTARHASPEAIERFLVPLLRQQGVPCRVEWVRDRARGRELGRYRRNLLEEQRRVDELLREVYPGLPEHYGEPVDGVRMTIEHVVREAAAGRERVLREEERICGTRDAPRV